MNKVEKIIYDLVKSRPWLKLAIRNIYQTALDILPPKANILPPESSIKEGFYYGFHDTTPFASDNSKLLANKLLHQELRMPKEGEGLAVGYFDLKDGKLGRFHQIGISYGWNFHKGCRLQWIDENRIIFNSSLQGSLCSEIVDIRNAKSTIISSAIDTVSPCGKYATSFSYTRLEHLMPGYGYPYDDGEAYLSDKAPTQTGLYLVDLEKDSHVMLYSLNELYRELDGYHNKGDFKHYVTHTEFSPSARYISFLHRWTCERDKHLRFSRLLIYDRRLKCYRELPTNGMVSHYVWRGVKLLAYCRVEGVDAHVEFNVENGTHKFIYPDRLNSDGHQSYVNENIFVTDTYPDRLRMQKLFRVDISDNSVTLLASTRHPKRFQSSANKGHTSCDYHPVCSPDGKYICFDAIINNRRSICVIPSMEKKL